MAPASAPGSPGGTVNALRPSGPTTSGRAPPVVATNGVPHAMASIAGSENQSSYTVVGKRNYSFQHGSTAPVDVEAIEITWSHTTQWLKSNYLGYDSPSVTPRGRDDVTVVVAQEARVEA